MTNGMEKVTVGDLKTRLEYLKNSSEIRVVVFDESWVEIEVDGMLILRAKSLNTLLETSIEIVS